jgi:hypothetical protein
MLCRAWFDAPVEYYAHMKDILGILASARIINAAGTVGSGHRDVRGNGRFAGRRGGLHGGPRPREEGASPPL